MKQFIKDAQASKPKTSRSKKIKEKKRKHSSGSPNESDVSESNTDDFNQQASDTENVSDNVKKPRSSGKIKNFFDRMSKQEQEHCKILLAKAIYTSGINFTFY